MPVPVFVRLPTAPDSMPDRSLIAPPKVVEVLFPPTVSCVALLPPLLPRTTSAVPRPLEASEPIDGLALVKASVALLAGFMFTPLLLASAALLAAMSVPA